MYLLEVGFGWRALAISTREELVESIERSIDAGDHFGAVRELDASGRQFRLVATGELADVLSTLSGC